MKFIQLMLSVLFLAAAAPARAGELDMLLDRLVEKNVIDPGEAQEIRIGTQEEVKKEISQQRHATLPMWLQTMKLRGDVRLRYQFNDNANKAITQHRGRFRLRFFADAKVNEKVYMGFGFASGSSTDPRSTNQTFGDNNAKKSLWIDYVFAEYNASDYVAFTAGRTRNPLWLTSDMLWDTDVNMEGLSARLALPVNYNWQVFANAGFMVLAEAASDPKDPYMTFVQPGVSWHDDAGVYDLKAGAAVYTFNNLDNSSELAHRPSTTEGYQKANTLVRSEYKYNYDALSPELELNANILDPVRVPLVTSLLGYNLTYAGLFGSYIKSLDHGSKSEGWIAGFKLGQRKVDDAGQWQLRYSLRRLEGDAWLDSYPDSDFFGGSTNVKGHEGVLTLGLLRDFAVDLDYYQAQPIAGNLKKEKLFQADINLKF
jgi:hypothetical protein